MKHIEELFRIFAVMILTNSSFRSIKLECFLSESISSDPDGSPGYYLFPKIGGSLLYGSYLDPFFYQTPSKFTITCEVLLYGVLSGNN